MAFYVTQLHGGDWYVCPFTADTQRDITVPEAYARPYPTRAMAIHAMSMAQQDAMLTPTAHEKAEWSRMARAAYAADRNDIGRRYSVAGSLPMSGQMTVGYFDRLQRGYRGWLTHNRWPELVEIIVAAHQIASGDVLLSADAFPFTVTHTALTSDGRIAVYGHDRRTSQGALELAPDHMVKVRRS